MKIKRTWNSHSLRSGEVDYIDEAQMRVIAGQTALAQHGKGECEQGECYYCPEPAMRRLAAGGKLEQFFSSFELVGE